MAERILLQPPLAVIATMQAIRDNARHDISNRQSRNPQPSLDQTEDYREATSSFLEKVNPSLKGVKGLSQLERGLDEPWELDLRSQLYG